MFPLFFWALVQVILTLNRSRQLSTDSHYNMPFNSPLSYPRRMISLPSCQFPRRPSSVLSPTPSSILYPLTNPCTCSYHQSNCFSDFDGLNRASAVVFVGLIYLLILSFFIVVSKFICRSGNRLRSKIKMV